MKILIEGKGIYIGTCEDCGTVFEAKIGSGEVRHFGVVGERVHYSECPVCSFNVKMNLKGMDTIKDPNALTIDCTNGGGK